MKSFKIKEEAKAPLYILALTLLLALSGVVRIARPDTLTEAFIAAIFLEVLVFALPTFFFLKYVDQGYAAIIKTKIRIRNLPLVISLLFTATFGFLLLNALSYVLGIASADFTSSASFIFSGISTKTNVFYVLFAFGIIPAVIEEFAFRGIIYRAYLKHGSFTAVIMSALAFAICNFSIASFGAYFFMGVVLAFSVRMTGNIWSAVFIRFFANGLSVYFLPALWNVIVQPMGILFALFIIVAIFFIFFIISLYLSEKYFARLSVTIPEKNMPSGEKYKTAKRLISLVIHPVFAAAVILSLIVALILGA